MFLEILEKGLFTRYVKVPALSSKSLSKFNVVSMIPVVLTDGISPDPALPVNNDVTV